MNELYSDALRAGIRTREFFEDLSFADVMDEIEAHADRTDERVRASAALLYRHANLVGLAFGGKDFPKTLSAAFPKLFSGEEGPDAAPTWKKQQAGMAAWVEEYNARRRKGAAKR